MKPQIQLSTLQDSSGSAVYLLKNERMELTLASLGAAIRSIRVPDKDGKIDDVALGWEDAKNWAENRPCFGVTVGRFANRIANSQFVLDSRVFPLQANDGPHHLHGGPLGFHRKMWSAEPWEDDREAGVNFRLTSPDGDAGYPGNVEVTAKISLTERNVIKIVLEATTDRATPVNLTNHTYFNLNGLPHESILDHVLWSSAEAWLPVDEGLIPLGEVRSAIGTPFDFRIPKPIGRDLSKIGLGYDHCLVLDSQNRPSAKVREAARVTSPSTGRTLRFYTNQPGFQFYSGNFLAGIPGRVDDVYKVHGGFCLESQVFPDSISRKYWESPVLRPGQVYRNELHYAFEF